ncbi:MAG: hypothetical protein D4Q79_01465 [Spirochaetia bacterium]|nr:MAG: hypothetical protein D4Q79_01465 [Spirochaetia bacterium]
MGQVKNFMPYEKIAKILRADKDNIRLLEERLGALTGKKSVMEKITAENEERIRERLDYLGLGRNLNAKQIYDALISKIEADNGKLFMAFNEPSAVSPNDWQKVLENAKKICGEPKGFFLKKEKAAEFLKNSPPEKILKALNYASVGEMLQKEDVFEIFPALRFVEGNEWLNNNFFNQYKNLSPEDFEEREVKVLALPERWAEIAKSFVSHKHHNISHLKEIGMIYVIPLSLEISGETLRNFGLILHYFSEVKFYSGLFHKAAENKDSFAQSVISLLRGDLVENRLNAPDNGKTRWLVVQRYLAKDDENDWRLFEPHINPEAMHWERAEKMLVETGKSFDGFSADLAFWTNLNWVGDYFPTESGIEVLVSFNLIDTAMSLVKEKEFIKYLYHHQEALWNKIFMEYFGEEKTEQMMEENILKGWFEV